MKTFNTILKLSLLPLFICSLFLIPGFSANAAKKDSGEELKIISPNYELMQYRNDDGSRTLTFKLSYVQELVPIAIKWKEVTFLQGEDQADVLGKAKTDARGIATFVISPEVNLLKDENGVITLGATFEGDSLFEAVSDQVSVKDAGMKIEIAPDDSIKTALVKVRDSQGVFDSVNLKEATVSFYVGRMFKPLKVGEATLDENGECSIEFPSDLPGDSLGFVNLFARIEDNDVYGNLQADTLIQWGIPTNHTVPTSFKALWTKVAPTWMVITLMILLLGVWGHYSFAVYKLVRIKKSALPTPENEKGNETQESEKIPEVINENPGKNIPS
jgi:hypothetical protein